MIKSMTGFGRAEVSDGKRNIVVEIRSVNHRYCDITVKTARRYAFAEEKIKAAIKETVKRGKLDVSVMVENLTEADVNIKLNTLVAKQYYDNLKKLQQELNIDVGIAPITTSQHKNLTNYNINGTRRNQISSGVNIISNGSKTVKLLKK